VSEPSGSFLELILINGNFKWANSKKISASKIGCGLLYSNPHPHPNTQKIPHPYPYPYPNTQKNLYPYPKPIPKYSKKTIPTPKTHTQILKKGMGFG